LRTSFPPFAPHMPYGLVLGSHATAAASSTTITASRGALDGAPLWQAGPPVSCCVVAPAPPPDRRRQGNRGAQ
jgi:hypothetical protein